MTVSLDLYLKCVGPRRLYPIRAQIPSLRFALGQCVGSPLQNAKNAVVIGMSGEPLQLILETDLINHPQWLIRRTSLSKCAEESLKNISDK